MKLDIITITKNDYDGILRTIQSTKALRYKFGVKQIIVDGSSGRVQKKVQHLVMQEVNAIYRWQKPSGIASAFNFAIKKSKGDWLWFLNGGDEVFKKIDYRVFMSILRHSSAGILIFEVEQNGKEKKHPPLHLVWPPLFNWVPHQGTLLRRDLFEKFGKFRRNYRIAMDGDLWLRLFSQHGVIVDMISLPIAVYSTGGIHFDSRVVAQETLESFWENREVLIRRSLNRFFLLVRALCLYTGRSLGLTK
jgi:putative colanic acid biosynthesis glycosyltransferase